MDSLPDLSSTSSSPQSSPSRQARFPTLRRIQGHIRRFSTLERKSVERLRTLITVREPESDVDQPEDISNINNELNNSSSLANPLKLPALSKSLRRLSLSDEITKELLKINEPLTTQGAAVTPGTSTAQPEDSQPKSSYENLLARRGVEFRDFECNSGTVPVPVPTQAPVYRARSSSLPLAQQLALGGGLQTSGSTTWIPDTGLRSVLQQTIRAQTVLGADQSPAMADNGVRGAAEGVAVRGAGVLDTDEAPKLANALSHALMLGQAQARVRPGELVSKVISEVIGLMNNPRSEQRDARIRAVISTIPRELNVATNPEPGSCDAAILAVIRKLEALLEIQSE